MRSKLCILRPLILTAFALVVSACNAGNAAPTAAMPAAITRVDLSPHANRKIKHIVILIQENRSLNNLFYGFPGARTTTYGYDTNGNKITLKPVSLETKWDLGHDAADYFHDCNGTGSIPGTNCKMNGFMKEFIGCGGASEPSCPNANPPYSYVPNSETTPYFDIGKQYVLADEMFASNIDGSFVAHQYLIAGQAEKSANFPQTSWGCPGGPGDKVPMIGPDRQVPYGSEVACWDTTTLGDELDNAGVSWAYYGVAWNGKPWLWIAYQAIKHIFKGPDWSKDIVFTPDQFFTDVKDGNLRSVTWLTPTWQNSDHASNGSKTGPSWVASVVNAVGQSQYWDSTAIFVLWDDWGGWYDPQAPKYLDYDGLGVRIPMLIVSPYAKQGYVSHEPYELGSVLKFVEDTFHLPRMAESDKRAKSPASDCFNFNQSPRTFKVIPAPHDVEYFLHQPVDNRIPDAE
jgi:phospholipase C